jgi:hypothetical protein
MHYRLLILTMSTLPMEEGSERIQHSTLAACGLAIDLHAWCWERLFLFRLMQIA